MHLIYTKRFLVEGRMERWSIADMFWIKNYVDRFTSYSSYIRVGVFIDRIRLVTVDALQENVNMRLK